VEINCSQFASNKRIEIPRDQAMMIQSSLEPRRPQRAEVMLGLRSRLEAALVRQTKSG